ncbi:hypothetical protein, partial [Yersinia similis]|uniref:hypothetical protein n=1 Tax=Yersinia similis TaxID=367190 RepID=UPI0016436B18
PWRGRFTPLPILTVQDRVIGVCQQSDPFLLNFAAVSAALATLPIGDSFAAMSITLGINGEKTEIKNLC